MKIPKQSKRKKDKKPKMGANIVLCTGVCLAIFLGVFSLSLVGDLDQPKKIEFEPFEYPYLEESTPLPPTYNTLEIHEEVVETASKYFEGVNLSDYLVGNFRTMEWRSSFYNWGGFIFVGLKGIEDNPERYKFVFTHEHAHSVLFKYGVKDHDTQEALTDVYTAFVERKQQADLFGESNEERQPPYNIYTKQIFENDNFDCLYNVFDEENKMSSYEEIITRLETWCGVEYKK